MKINHSKTRLIVVRLFVLGCVIYTLSSIVFDYESTTNMGISVSACTSRYIGATSEEELKQELVDEFAPTFVFSLGEPTNLEEEVIVPYQIVPDPQEPDRYVWRGAVTYPIDYGASSYGVRLSIGTDRHSISLSKTVLRIAGWVLGQAHVDAHIGDVEMFELYLKPSEDADFWEIDALTTFPHGKRKVYSASAVRCFRDSPILYISRGKHAMYPSLQECNQYSGRYRQGVHLSTEHCSIEELFYPSTSPEFNVGDSINPVNVFETSPTIRESEIYLGEDAWGSCFFGGYGDAAKSDPCRSRFSWW